MLAIIMAGGRGTRISAIAQDIPKPMIPICGVPVLEREIVCLRKSGIYRYYPYCESYGRSNYGLLQGWKSAGSAY